jgi:hypothetical protein
MDTFQFLNFGFALTVLVLAVLMSFRPDRESRVTLLVGVILTLYFGLIELRAVLVEELASREALFRIATSAMYTAASAFFVRKLLRQTRIQSSVEGGNPDRMRNSVRME